MTLPGSNGVPIENQQIAAGVYEWMQQHSAMQRMIVAPGPSGGPNENPQMAPGICDPWWLQSAQLPYPSYPWYPYPCFPGDPMKGQQQMNYGLQGLQISEEPKKKGRVSFSKEQIAALEARFQHDNHIRKPERETFARMWRMTPEQVKIWFQNQRYKRRKQGKLGGSNDGNSPQGGSCNASFSTSNEISQPSTPENSSSNSDPSMGPVVFTQNAPGTPQLPDFMTPMRMNPSYPIAANTEANGSFNQSLMSQNGVSDNGTSCQMPNNQWNQYSNQFYQCPPTYNNSFEEGKPQI